MQIKRRKLCRVIVNCCVDLLLWFLSTKRASTSFNINNFFNVNRIECAITTSLNTVKTVNSEHCLHKYRMPNYSSQYYFNLINNNNRTSFLSLILVNIFFWILIAYELSAPTKPISVLLRRINFENLIGIR